MSTLTDEKLYEELRGALRQAFNTGKDSDEQLKLEKVLETIRLRLLNHGGVKQHSIFRNVAYQMKGLCAEDLTNPNVIPTIRVMLMHATDTHPWDFS